MQPNRWSCSITALSYLIGEDVTSRFEHDGSEILWPDLPEPACRRGFHPQELALVALSYGYAMIEFLAEPLSGHTIEDAVKIETKIPWKEHPGLIYAKAGTNMHWWASRGGQVYDPSNDSLISLDLFDHPISAFYVVLRLKY